MAEAHTEKKPTNWIAIIAPVLTVLWMVWFYDRELRINDLKETNADLRKEKTELKQDLKDEKADKEKWIVKYIESERQIPQILDTLKARIKTTRNE